MYKVSRYVPEKDRYSLVGRVKTVRECYELVNSHVTKRMTQRIRTTLKEQERMMSKGVKVSPFFLDNCSLGIFPLGTDGDPGVTQRPEGEGSTDDCVLSISEFSYLFEKVPVKTEKSV